MSNPIDIIKNVTWGDPSKFRVSFIPTGMISILHLNKLKPDLITMALNDIKVSNISFPADSVFYSGRHYACLNIKEPHTLNLSFKDFNNHMLYKTFFKFLIDSEKYFPNDKKFNIKIESADGNNNNKFIHLITLKECLITGVDGTKFDNSALSSIDECSIDIFYPYADL